MLPGPEKSYFYKVYDGINVAFIYASEIQVIIVKSFKRISILVGPRFIKALISGICSILIGTSAFTQNSQLILRLIVFANC